jgi:hypothetical protein
MDFNRIVYSGLYIAEHSRFAAALNPEKNFDFVYWPF